MATYDELHDLQNNNPLLEKITVAIVIAADAIRSEAAGTTNHANRLVWAKSAFADPRGIRSQVLWAVLAANKSASVTNISGASDAAIQANVDAVVDVLAGS